MIWISWEKQRRTIELAKSFNLPLYIIDQDLLILKKIKLLNYLFLSIKTFILIYKLKPKKLFVQNPSMILSALVCFLKNIFKYKLIVDRHSNFRFFKHLNFKYNIIRLLSNYTIRNADLTIVTNIFLADYISRIGGKSFILEDKIPNFTIKNTTKLLGNLNIVYICSFSEDEPINEVIEAVRFLSDSDDVFLYITGNYSNHKDIINITQRNVVFTGYLSDFQYESLLFSSDLILVLTKNDYTLTCGTYEGIAMEKPLIISDTNALKYYFNSGVIYTLPNSKSINESIIQAFNNIDILSKNIKVLKNNLILNWNKKFKNINSIINNL